MIAERRYFPHDDLETGVTRSELSRLSTRKQADYVRHWFVIVRTAPVTPREIR
jgi:hypothetical protein